MGKSVFNSPRKNHCYKDIIFATFEPCLNSSSKSSWIVVKRIKMFFFLIWNGETRRIKKKCYWQQIWRWGTEYGKYYVFHSFFEIILDKIPFYRGIKHFILKFNWNTFFWKIFSSLTFNYLIAMSSLMVLPICPCFITHTFILVVNPSWINKCSATTSDDLTIS